MHFIHPAFLFIAVAVFVGLTLLFFVTDKARRRALARFGAERLLAQLTATVSPKRRRLKQAAFALGIALVLCAFARPQLGYRWEEVHRRGVDLLFAIDTSKSMLTRDVKPNRLERAKLAVRSLVEKFPDNRVGLVAFAGQAFIETPLTLDHGIFDESVAALDTNVIPAGGTNLASAIEHATEALAGDTHDKVLVLLTDGEELSGDALDAARRAAKQGLVIHAIGVGTPNGELVPEPDADGQSRFVRDPDGQLVTSRLDETRLAAIAQATGGEYRPLGDAGQGLESLYRDRLAKLALSDLSSRSVRAPIERFQWPLAAGLLLLGIEPLISERKRQRARRVSLLRPALSTGLIAVCVLLPAAAWASPQSAEHAYAKGDFKTAEREYAEALRSSPSDPRLSFNTGAAAYRKGAYEDAAKGFESTLRSTDLGLQEQAYYNLGNAAFRLGQASLAKQDVEGTKAHWKQAIDAYERALRLRADDGDARFNLDFVRRKLAELDQQQPKSPQQQNQQGQGQQGQPQNQQGQGQQGQSQNQQGQGQSQNQGHGQQGQSQDQQGQGQQGQPQNQQGQGQQGQPQNQQGQGQAQNQQGQGQQGQAQNQQGQGQQGQSQNQPGQSQGRAETQPDQRGSQQPPAGGTSSPAQRQAPGPQQSSGAGAPEQNGSASDRSGPGTLSKADAAALLDSMRGELALGARPPKSPQQARPEEPQKDW